MVPSHHPRSAAAVDPSAEGDALRSREGEQRLRIALDAARQGWWHYDPVRRVVWWDARYQEIFGITSEQDSVDAVMSRLHAADVAGVWAAVEAALDPADPRAYSTEYRIHRPDGAVRWVEAHGAASFEGEGDDRHATAFVGTVADITERKDAEARLRAAHDTFRHLVEHSPFGVYAVDADFRLVQVSAVAQKVFEHVRPLLGRDFAGVIRQLWPEPFATEAIGRFRHTLETGEPYRAVRMIEQRHDTDDIESYDWKIERVILPDGRPGVVCHFYDLSERLRHEEALRASEARFRAVFERAATGIAIAGTDGRFLQCNPAFTAMLGYTEEELLQRTFGSLIHPDDREASLALFQRLVARELPSHEVENRFIRKDGHEILAHRFVSLLPGGR